MGELGGQSDNKSSGIVRQLSTVNVFRQDGVYFLCEVGQLLSLLGSEFL